MPAYYLEIAIVLLGLGLLMADAFAGNRNRLFIGVTAFLGVAAVLVALFFVERNPGGPLWGIYATDSLALFYKGLALTATLLVLVIALEFAPVVSAYRDGPPNRRGLGEFYALPVLICAGLMWMASMTELIGIFVTLETVTITFYVLVAYLRQNVGSLEAGVKYLILGALSTGVLVYGIAWIFGLTGQTHLQAIGVVLADWPGAPGPVMFASALLLVGLVFKAGGAPFQFWIPDVYQGAPTPITAFLSVGSKAAGFIVLMRVLSPLVLSPVGEGVLTLLAVIAGATLLIGNLAAIPQSNFKRLLAYSSIGHAGFLLMALASRGSAFSLLPSTVVSLYLATYLPMTMLAFLILVIVRRAGGSDDLSAFDGLGRRSPMLAFAMLVAAASLAGVPLTAGFFGKFFAIILAAGDNQWLLVALAVIAAAAGFYYYFKVIRSMYWNDPPAAAPPLVCSKLTSACIVVVTASILLLGVFPTPILVLLQR
jgi:NADH-quinone oxidoreductase subunit N